MTERVLRSMLELRKQRLCWRSVWTLLVAIPLLVSVFDPEQFGSVLSAAAQALMGTLPYVAIAVVLVAGLKATGAETLVAKAFEGRESRMIVLAGVLGGLAPFCSCEVIPFIAGLLALGAPLSAVMAFWLSSPLIDPPTMIITGSVLGWDFAVGKTLAAVGLGLFGGFGPRLLLRSSVFSDPLRIREQGGCCASATSAFSGRPVWTFWHESQRLRVFAREGLHNGIFLIKWLSLAYLLKGLLITYVLAQLIGGIVGGDGLLPIVWGALLGAPAYLNGYAAPALLAALIEQGMSVGAAMAFLVAGAVSCIPAMAAVCSLVKVKVFVSYLLLGITGAMLSGFLFAALVRALRHYRFSATPAKLSSSGDETLFA